MNKPIDDGGPAFAAPEQIADTINRDLAAEMAFPGRRFESRQYWTGMTLRDYFAAKALQGLIAEPPHDRFTATVCEIGPKPTEDEPGNFAKAAYLLADAMLKARKESNGH